MAHGVDKMTGTATKTAQDTTDEVTLVLTDDAAREILQLRHETGLPINTLIETSIGLLRAAVRARTLGQRVLVATRTCWPIKEFVLPKAS